MRFRAALLMLLLAGAVAAACSTTATLPFGGPSGTTPPGSPTPFPSPSASPLSTAITGNLVLNSCFAVSNATSTAAQLVGASALDASANGTLLLFLQVTDDQSPRASGNQSPLDAAALAGAGLYDVAPLLTAATIGSATSVTLRTPLQNTYASDSGRSAEACVVPAFDTLTVSANATIRAEPWNGARGGIVAVAARVLHLDGSIDASGAGFPGGIANATGTIVCGETGLDYSMADSAGGKGFGSDSRGNAGFGAGNSLEGGGGGNDVEGGAGGGNGGAGGSGGNEGGSCTSGGATRARGGAPIALAPQTRLTFGGGGGGGNGTAGPGAGGRGGGIVILSAGTLDGSGSIAVAGATPVPSSGATSSLGEGGGGAGGSLWIRDNATWNFVGSIDASGADGGSAASIRSPGGGGGGGRLQIGPHPGTSVVNSGGAGGAQGSGGAGGGGGGSSW